MSQPNIHYHGGSKCGFMHDPSCTGLGPEESCVWDSTRGQYVCTHGINLDISAEGDEAEDSGKKGGSSTPAK